ncbi:ThuA domain-containing protein [Pontibacter harenae]|uniref:ThuA domain-containing protein n=1 Tax=Pontibacter harenae TaxID=2894083 RepID=UPI001E3F4D06|nr:ThuA domain-containing protein [Pontibacter harenae]MCC9166837.1 ThuA domain-containing protein [Pontibacter harenae]
MIVIASCSDKRSGQPRVLVYSTSSDFHRASVTNGNAAIFKLGQENDFAVDTTSNPGLFTQNNLEKYGAVVFLSTSGEELNSNQRANFERYIQAGGAFVGVHAAADTSYTWDWYSNLLGGTYQGNPQTRQTTVQVVAKNHAATEELPAQWQLTDEWFTFNNLNKDLQVLLQLTGGKNNSPVAWYHNFDGGRSFYTALGHTPASYEDPQFLNHLLGGITYAIGDNEELNYGAATSEQIPEEERFVKTTLTEGTLFEPTEMAVLPNLNILVAQRRGELMLYNQQDKSIKQVGFLNVYFKTNTPGVNAEEGLLGIAADPNFAENNYIYLYYSPIDTSVNRLSRFVFKNNKLDLSSEKIVLQLYSQREICCHTGGSIAFGPDNMLYLSTGDNSTPFDEKGQAYLSHGFAPLDDRPGHEQYDARRTAGNTNDLRGKILRIRVKPDGTYEIPEGNLFPKNESKARPEIYVMGDRNPYRISVDQKNGFLYWGEIGPDSGVDSLSTRGPRGYDEVNQARKAGFYGWPYFIGDNYSYNRYDYGTGKVGAGFDPKNPINDSRNNTGLRQLPPAQPAFIWYPYSDSPDFPQVGSGGRSAMTGPVYYTDMFPAATRYPDYYNGKLFIYEWIRNWIKVVTLKENGDYDRMESFMGSAKFNAPIDMEVGPDGRFYVLEYGAGWFAKNPDSGISRVDYVSGNMPPQIASFLVDKRNGDTPLTIKASVEANDLENDQLKYIWKVGNFHKETKEPRFEYTINSRGDHNVSVEVVDSKGGITKSSEIPVYVGNVQPRVNIEVQGNRSFYFPGKSVKYKVAVTDEDGEVDPENLFVSKDYVQGLDLAGASMGHQVLTEAMIGKNLMLESDCRSCHQVAEKSIGPSFTQVSVRYQKDPEAPAFLTQKIIKGGGGVWGETAMPAHPNMPEGEARQIVQWVLSLADREAMYKSEPANGELNPTVEAAGKQNSVLKLTATYTDKGGKNVKPLAGSQALYLRSNTINAGELKTYSWFAERKTAGNTSLAFPTGDGWVKVDKIDLTGLSAVELTGVSNGQAARYQVELRVGDSEGTKIGEGTIAFGDGNSEATGRIPVQANSAKNELQDVYVVVRPITEVGKNRPLLRTIKFLPK